MCVYVCVHACMCVHVCACANRLHFPSPGTPRPSSTTRTGCWAQCLQPMSRSLTPHCGSHVGQRLLRGAMWHSDTSEGTRKRHRGYFLALAYVQTRKSEHTTAVSSGSVSCSQWRTSPRPRVRGASSPTGTGHTADPLRQGSEPHFTNPRSLLRAGWPRAPSSPPFKTCQASARVLLRYQLVTSKR